MKRWLIEFAAEAEIGIPENEKEVVCGHPDGRYSIVIRRKPLVETTNANLAIYVDLQAASIEVASELAEQYARDFINYASYVSGGYYSIINRTFAVDWTRGIAMREMWLWAQPSDFNYLAHLEENLRKSILLLQSEQLSPAVKKALRWYASGLRAKIPEDQFQYFWFCVETISSSKKSTIKVSDKCQKCSGALICSECGKTSTHRPFEKQVIGQQLNALGLPQVEIDILFKVRNLLMHGEDREMIESALSKKFSDYTFDQSVDLLGQVAWGIIFKASDIKASEKPFDILQMRTYLHTSMQARIEMEVGTKGNSHDPNIDDISIPMIEFSSNQSEEI